MERFNLELLVLLSFTTLCQASLCILAFGMPVEQNLARALVNKWLPSKTPNKYVPDSGMYSGCEYQKSVLFFP